MISLTISNRCYSRSQYTIHGISTESKYGGKSPSGGPNPAAENHCGNSAIGQFGTRESVNDDVVTIIRDAGQSKNLIVAKQRPYESFINCYHIPYFTLSPSQWLSNCNSLVTGS